MREAKAVGELGDAGFGQTMFSRTINSGCCALEIVAHITGQVIDPYTRCSTSLMTRLKVIYARLEIANVVRHAATVQPVLSVTFNAVHHAALLTAVQPLLLETFTANVCICTPRPMLSIP